MTKTLKQVIFPAMGNTVNLTVIGADHLIEHARHRIAEIESRWSRFIAASDLSRLNRARGRATPVHHDTIVLVRYLIDAQWRTAFHFDPTLAPTLNALGYEFSRTDDSLQCILGEEATSGVDLGKTTIDEQFNAVTLPFGATLDAGGLGKGLAADIVSRELIERGATGVCLSIGGDIRCLGQGPIDGHWSITVASPKDSAEPMTTIHLLDGGVATSSLGAKTWNIDGLEHHHVLDSSTKKSVDITRNSIVQATVIASEAVWAEVYATQLLIAGFTTAVDSLGCMVIRQDGSIDTNEAWKEFERE